MRHSLDTSLHENRVSSLASALMIGALPAAQPAAGQNTPLISGGVGFITITNGGNTTYIPIVTPLIAAPLGTHLLVESRATIVDLFSPKGTGQSGYDSSWFLGLTYLQLDYLANRHMTVVGGEFLTPFATYNERLTPIWISNFTDRSPDLFPGHDGTGSSVGRHAARLCRCPMPRSPFDYAAYFSAASTNSTVQFAAIDWWKGRRLLSAEAPRDGSFLWPPAWRCAQQLSWALHAMVGAGGHSIQASIGVRARRALAGILDGDGFSISPGHWMDTILRLERLEPVFRWQQTFRNSPDSTRRSACCRHEQRGFRTRLSLSARGQNQHQLFASVFVHGRPQRVGDWHRLSFSVSDMERQMKNQWRTSGTRTVLLALQPVPTHFRQARATPTAKPPASPQSAKSSNTRATQERDGERKFQQNCSRCHKAPEGFPSHISGTIVRHMRVRASLSAEDEREILRFLNP